MSNGKRLSSPPSYCMAKHDVQSPPRVICVKTLVLLSGGKDSVVASHVAAQQGWELVGACSLVVTGEDSYMFHRPNARWTPLVAEALGLRHFLGETDGAKEHELADLEALLVEAKEATGAEAVVSGALASEYQRTRIERIGHAVGLKTFAPLWHKPRIPYVRSLVQGGFHVMMVAAATEGLGQGWLGRTFTERALVDLERQASRFRFDVAGEGGEYETLVTDGPGFERPIEIVSAKRHWRRDHGWYEIEEARLGEPHSGPAPLPVE